MITMKTRLSVLFLLVLIPLKAGIAESSERLIFEKDSLYQYIVVVEDTVRKERYVRNQKKEYAQGGIFINAPDRLLFEFTQIGFIGLAFLDREPKEALFIGLGAGAMPKYFNRHYPEAMTDVVEIDPDMVAVAQKYFFFRENPGMKVYVEDGRQFVKKSRKKYDWIVLDAYQNEYIPFHLTTLEFLKEVRGRLQDDGVVVSNITSEYRNKFLDSMVMTYKKVFPHLYVFKGKKSGNYIFVATADRALKSMDAIAARAEKIQKVRKMDIDLAEICLRCELSTDYEYEGAKILTDDFAPVHMYKFQKSGAK